MLILFCALPAKTTGLVIVSLLFRFVFILRFHNNLLSFHDVPCPSANFVIHQQFWFYWVSYLPEGMALINTESTIYFVVRSIFFHVRFLQRYVQKETENMQSSKSKLTATTLATRQKKMAEMCSLVKYFIRYANKRKRNFK